MGEKPGAAENQIRGLGPITMTVPDLASTDTVLTQVMNMRRCATTRIRKTSDTRPCLRDGRGRTPDRAELHVAVRPNCRAAHPGAGGVHHVAFRTPDADYDAWADRLKSLRVPNSGKVDRFWFRSLYFREPNGILFELASDGPGFGVDEPMDKLGETLVLPPFLEGRRSEIEAGLKPL